MTSHFAQYFKEREGLHTLEAEYGFVIYAEYDSKLFIKEMFVVPEKRSHGNGNELYYAVENVALNKGFSAVVCQVDVRAPYAARNTEMILKKGFNIVAADHSIITFVKELANGRDS